MPSKHSEHPETTAGEAASDAVRAASDAARKAVAAGKVAASVGAKKAGKQLVETAARAGRVGGKAAQTVADTRNEARRLSRIG